MFSLFNLLSKTLGLWAMFYLEQYKNLPMSVVPTLHRPVGWDLGKLMLKTFTGMSWRLCDEGRSLQRRWAFFRMFLWLAFPVPNIRMCASPRVELNPEPLILIFFSTKTSYCSFLHCDMEGMAMKFWKFINSMKEFLCQIVTVFINNHSTELCEWRKSFSFALMGECEPKYLKFADSLSTTFIDLPCCLMF